MRIIKLAVTAISIAVFSSQISFAQSTSGKPAASVNNKVNPKIQSELIELTKRMKANPNDLDAFYAYAKLSTSVGMLKSSENAYLHMLKVNPKLDKIKTALAIIYIRMEKKDEAIKLFNEVLANNPPPVVRKNIIATIDTLKSSKNRSVAEAQKPSAAAQAPQTAMAQPQQPSISPEEMAKRDKAQFEDLSAKIKQNPKDLDAYYAYAKTAEKLAKADEAEKAYLHMLEASPNLDRVRLDLALLYIKIGKLEESKALFEKVLAKNPPENVKANITTILAKVNQALKKDLVSVSTSVGFNSDTNANSAASTGETTYSDVSIPLAQSSQAKGDLQWFGTASLTHLHKFKINNPDYGANLTTTGTYYKTNQTTLHNLDISLLSIKSGPTFSLNKLKSTIGFNGALSLIRLNGSGYMRTTSTDAIFKFAPIKPLVFDYTYTYEYRKFSNSTSSTTTTDRTGNASQEKIGATYSLTEKDLFNTAVTWRSERAREDKYGNHQINMTLSYTRQLPYKTALNLLAGFKKTRYNDIDSSISSLMVRNDREKSVTATLAKQLPKNVTATASYQYKNVDSNIQNYTYTNHRTGMAISWSF